MPKTLPLIFCVIFVLFAAVQHNDPDPLLWIGIYGLTAGICFAVSRGWYQKQILQLLGLVFFVVASWQFPPVWEGVSLNAIGMKTTNIELARESLGLGFCSVVFAIFSFFKVR